MANQEISVNDVLAILGHKEVELTLLRGQLEALGKEVELLKTSIPKPDPAAPKLEVVK